MLPSFSNYLCHGVKIQSFDALNDFGWNPIGKQHMSNILSLLIESKAFLKSAKVSIAR